MTSPEIIKGFTDDSFKSHFFFPFLGYILKVFLKKWVRTMCPLQLLMEIECHLHLVREKMLAELLLSNQTIEPSF